MFVRPLKPDLELYLSEVIDLSVGDQGEGHFDFPYYLLPLLVVHTQTPPPLPVVCSRA